MPIRTPKYRLHKASEPWLMEHVRQHNVDGTRGATLIKAAKDADRVGEFRQAFEAWLMDTKSRIEADEVRRAEEDEEPLSASETRPQRYLSAEQVRAWKTALEKGLPLTEPGFRYKALIKEERGQRRIEADAISKNLDELSVDDAGKLLVRFVDLSDELKRVVKEKAEAEKQAKAASGEPPKSSPGEDLLKDLLREARGPLPAESPEEEEDDQDEDEEEQVLDTGEPLAPPAPPKRVHKSKSCDLKRREFCERRRKGRAPSEGGGESYADPEEE